MEQLIQAWRDIAERPYSTPPVQPQTGSAPADNYKSLLFSIDKFSGIRVPLDILTSAKSWCLTAVPWSGDTFMNYGIANTFELVEGCAQQRQNAKPASSGVVCDVQCSLELHCLDQLDSTSCKFVVVELSVKGSVYGDVVVAWSLLPMKSSSSTSSPVFAGTSRALHVIRKQNPLAYAPLMSKAMAGAELTLMRPTIDLDAEADICQYYPIGAIVSLAASSTPMVPGIRIDMHEGGMQVKDAEPTHLAVRGMKLQIPSALGPEIIACLGPNGIESNGFELRVCLHNGWRVVSSAGPVKVKTDMTVPALSFEEAPLDTGLVMFMSLHFLVSGAEVPSVCCGWAAIPYGSCKDGGIGLRGSWTTSFNTDSIRRVLPQAIFRSTSGAVEAIGISLTLENNEDEGLSFDVNSPDIFVDRKSSSDFDEDESETESSQDQGDTSDASQDQSVVKTSSDPQQDEPQSQPPVVQPATAPSAPAAPSAAAASATPVAPPRSGAAPPTRPARAKQPVAENQKQESTAVPAATQLASSSKEHVTFRAVKADGTPVEIIVHVDDTFNAFRVACNSRIGRVNILVPEAKHGLSGDPLVDDIVFSELIDAVLDDWEGANNLQGVVTCSIQSKKSISSPAATPQPAVGSHIQSAPSAPSGSLGPRRPVHKKSQPVDAQEDEEHLVSGNVLEHTPAPSVASQGLGDPSPRSEITLPVVDDLRLQQAQDSVHAMTRAVKSKLFNTPLDKIVSDLPSTVPFAMVPPPKLNTAIEKADTLQTNQVVMHFVGVKVHPSLRSVAFRIDFFNFPTVLTKPVVVERDSNDTEYHACSIKQTNASQSDDGLTVSFWIDPKSTEDTSLPLSFAAHLANSTADITVLDGASMLPVGVARVPLSSMLRNGLPAVQWAVELSLYDPLAGATATKQMDSIYVRFVNVGRSVCSAPNAGKWSFADENSHPNQVVEPITSMAGASLASQAQSDKPVHPKVVSEGLALLYANRRDMQKKVNQGAGGVVSPQLFGEIMRSCCPSASVECIQAMQQTLPHAAPGGGGKINASAAISRLKLSAAHRMTEAVTDVTQSLEASISDDCELFLAACVKSYGSVAAAASHYAPEGNIFSASLSRLFEDLRIPQPEKRIEQILVAAGGKSSLTDGVTVSQLDSLFEVVLAPQSGVTGGSASISAGEADKEERRRRRWAALKSSQGQASASSRELEQNINVAKNLRSLNRDHLVSQVLKQVISSSVVLRLKEGDSGFFVHRFRNIFPTERKVKISVGSQTAEADPAGVQVITDVAKWSALRQASRNFKDMPEPDQVDESAILFLKSNEEVGVPFCWTGATGGVPAPLFNAVQGAAFENTSIIAALPQQMEVIFKALGSSDGNGNESKAMSAVKLHVLPQSSCPDAIIRLYQAQGEVMRKKISVNSARLALPSNWSGMLFARCSNPNVAVTCKPSDQDDAVHDLVLKLAVPESTYPNNKPIRFSILLFPDKFNSLVVCRYHVEVYAMERIHVKATVGQGCKVPLVLRGTGTMNVHTSHPHEFTVPEAVNVQGGLQQANLIFKPVAAGKRSILVHVVNDVGTVSAGYLLVATVQEPLITNRYEVQTSIGRPSNKKITFINPYGAEKTFLLSSSNPAVVEPRESKLSLGPNGQGFIQLRFKAQQRPQTLDAVIFVNDEGDRTEEALALKIKVQ